MREAYQMYNDENGKHLWGGEEKKAWLKAKGTWKLSSNKMWSFFV